MVIYSVKSLKLKELSPEINKIRKLVYHEKDSIWPFMSLRPVADLWSLILGG